MTTPSQNNNENNYERAKSPDFYCCGLASELIKNNRFACKTLATDDWKPGSDRANGSGVTCGRSTTSFVHVSSVQFRVAAAEPGPRQKLQRFECVYLKIARERVREWTNRSKIDD